MSAPWTAFPSEILVGASFDPAVARSIGAAIAREAGCAAVNGIQSERVMSTLQAAREVTSPRQPPLRRGEERAFLSTASVSC